MNIYRIYIIFRCLSSAKSDQNMAGKVPELFFTEVIDDAINEAPYSRDYIAVITAKKEDGNPNPGDRE